MAKTFWIAAAIMAAAIAAPASASTYVVDYTGSVIAGTDNFGIFGSIGSSVSGQRFEAIFSYNLESPSSSVYDFSPPSTEEIIDGSGSAASATLKIDNSSYTFPSYLSHGTSQGDNSTNLLQEPTSHGTLQGVSSLVIENNYNSPIREAFIASVGTVAPGHSIFSSTSYQSPIDFDVSSSDSGRGEFQYTVLGQGTANFGFDIAHVSTHVSGAPEPGTWAMMLLGLGLVGWTMRRRMATARTPALAAA